MKKLRIYLDTSVINFLFADDAPEKRDITREFFAERLARHDVYISDTVLVEIANTRDPVKRRVVPGSRSQWEDALHVAVATVLAFDLLLSWNFRHMANVERQEKINRVNCACGYEKQLLLVTPMEVLNEGENE